MSDLRKTGGALDGILIGGTNTAHEKVRREVVTLILSGKAIRERLDEGTIFRRGTWDESALKEASYALRIAPDGLILDGKQYKPGKAFDGDYIEIKPGMIAILSTVERMNMPPNLVGKIGIRLDHAQQGITGLMGIQVDPLYGHDKPDERLFIRVANLGNESIRLTPYEHVFTFELHTVEGDVEGPASGRECSWTRITRVLSNQRNSGWTYVTRVRSDLSAETQRVRDTFQPVVLFGVFLVAATLLGVVITLILSVRDTPQIEVPAWVTDWGWILLMGTLCAATVATAWIGVAAGLHLTSSFVWRRRDVSTDVPIDE